MNARHDAAVPNTESTDSHRIWEGALVQHPSSMCLPVQEKTAGGFVQPVFRERAALVPANRKFLQGLRDLCDKAGPL